MKKLLSFFLVFFILFILTTWFSKKPSDTYKIDLKINRFDEQVFSLNEKNIINLTNDWDSLFGSFPFFFASQILKVSDLSNNQYYNELLQFSHHKDMREAYDSTVLLFADITDIKNSLELGFGRFSIDFPSFSIPEITIFFGGFNYAVFTYDNNIAIGLENFLGKNSKFYQFLGDPEYLKFQKQRKFIVSNVMEVWFNECFQKYLVGQDLLSQMIYKGKMMYFLDHVLREVPVEDKFRFTKEQMNWVIENELNVWEHLIYKDLLFSKKESEFRTFLSYSPFAKGMPEDAPGRIGYYIGYRIVCDYMNNNNINIEDLMYLTDSQDFLRKSKYKPLK